MSKLKKTLIIIFSGLVVLAILLILLISPITKYLIEKYDVQFTGREITLDWAYVNPFTGYVHLSGLEVFEEENDQVFLSLAGLSANLSLRKLFSSTYEIKNVKLKRPRGYVIQNDSLFNFSDLIERFTSKDSIPSTDEPVKFNLLNIKIEDGEFHYQEQQSEVNFFIKDVNISSKGLRYNVDTIPINFEFASGIGSGDVSGDAVINLDNLNYKLNIKIDSFNLEIINQYLKELTNFGTFEAMLNAHINTQGNFATADSISTSGKIAISEFHFGKNKNEDFASFEELVIDIVKLSPKDLIYHYDSISLRKPFFKYELYDYLDNIQTMFGAGGENVASVNADPNKFNLVIEIAKLVEQLSRNFLRSQYKVGRVAVYDGDIQFNDYSLGDKFEMHFNPFTVLADSVDKSKDRVEVIVKSGIKPYGDFRVSLSVNPRDSSYFDLDYKFEKLPLTMFNPYLTTFTSFPLDRGSLDFIGKWKVRDGEINSDNHLILIDPRNAKKIRNKDNQWIPLPLAFAFIREKGNVIDYEIPIRGNLKDPKFVIKDVIFDLLRNIFVKPITVPYRMEVKTVEQSMEKSLFMKWDMEKDQINKEQERFIKRIVDFLKENPENKISVTPKLFEKKEKELILLFEIKKAYFISKNKLKANKLSDKDSVAVARMSIKDEGFIKFLNEKVESKIIFTTQQKSALIIDQKLIDRKYDQLNKARMQSFLALFKDEKIENQVKFNKAERVVPFNGFSTYFISYQGDFPEYLIKAFEKMNEFNSEAPREQYLDKRERNKLKK